MLKLNSKTFFMVPETTLIGKEWTFDWSANIEIQKIILNENKIKMIFEKILKMDDVETQKNNPNAEKIIAAILNLTNEDVLPLITEKILELYSDWQKRGIKEQYFIFSKAFNLDLDFFMLPKEVQFNTMLDFIKNSFQQLNKQYQEKKILSLQFPLYNRPVGGISRLSTKVDDDFWNFVQTEVNNARTSKSFNLKLS